MKAIVILVLALVVAAILVLAPHNADAADYAWLEPDAIGAVQVADGAIPATTLECASWHVADALSRRVWFDLLDPLTAPGIGGSIDLTPGGAACVGGGYRGARFFGYVGIHASL